MLKTTDKGDSGMNNRTDINSLRDALEFLETQEGQLVQTDVEVDPVAELCGVYRYIGNGGTTMRPTKVNGPAMIFNNIKGFDRERVLIGLLGNRQRVADMMGCSKYDLPKEIYKCVNNPIPPVVSDEPAPCHEVVHLATDEDFDIRKILPAPTNTPYDAGPYLTLGFCYATHPDTGDSDLTVHRLCLQGKDEMSIFFTPGSRHIGAMYERATELNQPLPISISIGLDPALEILTSFEPPTTPLGYNELSAAGAWRGKPVQLTRCLTINENAIANAEYVIEGEVLPGVEIPEDQNTKTGSSMPEFPGFLGKSAMCNVIKVKAITHRKNPIMQVCIGCGEEHVNLAGLPTEASIWGMIEKSMPGKVTGINMHRSGGGKYMAILRFRKTVLNDEGRQRQAALIAFAAFTELKHIIIVDDDVDIFDTDDVMWAMNTRFQADRDIVTIPGVRCHPLDPSSNPKFDPSIDDKGISCKTIFDCTHPVLHPHRFRRAPFMEVDPTKWVPDFKF